MGGGVGMIEQKNVRGNFSYLNNFSKLLYFFIFLLCFVGQIGCVYFTLSLPEFVDNDNVSFCA